MRRGEMNRRTLSYYLILLITSIFLLGDIYQSSADTMERGEYYYNEEYDVSIVFPENWELKNDPFEKDELVCGYSNEVEKGIIFITANTDEKFDFYDNLSKEEHKRDIEVNISSSKEEAEKKNNDDYSTHYSYHEFSGIPFVEMFIDNDIEREYFIGYMGVHNGTLFTIGGSFSKDLSLGESKRILSSVKTFKFGRIEGLVETDVKNTSFIYIITLIVLLLVIITSVIVYKRYQLNHSKIEM